MIKNAKETLKEIVERSKEQLIMGVGAAAVLQDDGLKALFMDALGALGHVRRYLEEKSENAPQISD